MKKSQKVIHFPHRPICCLHLSSPLGSYCRKVLEKRSIITVGAEKLVWEFTIHTGGHYTKFTAFIHYLYIFFTDRMH